MKRIFLAAAVSTGVHAALALALSAWLVRAPEPEVLASLDVSSVELSFAEEEVADASPADLPQPLAPGAPAEPSPSIVPEPAPASTVIAGPAPPQPPRFAHSAAPEPSRPVMTSPSAPPPPSAAEPQPPLPSPRQARVDAPPRPKRNIRPDYPKGARQRGEQGDVRLEIRVSAEGGVDEVRVVGSSGYPELDEAAVRAAKAARFAPARSGRDAVASLARLTLTFKLK